MKWISSLAVADAFHGQGMGPRAVEEAEALVSAMGEEFLYLDCYEGNGFLPGYYESLGYKRVATRQHSRDGGQFTVVALRKELTPRN